MRHAVESEGEGERIFEHEGERKSYQNLIAVAVDKYKNRLHNYSQSQIIKGRIEGWVIGEKELNNCKK